MNNEALRKEIYEELHSQYESKLKDAKKQKSQLEEELESSSAKWRAERRRLNAEIDRLETALADNRDSRRKTVDAKTSRTETQDVAKLQAAADEKLKKAKTEWEGERTKLQSEIARLQGGVAELLERANNPLRAGQAARELLERKLEEALKTREQAEETLLATKEQWEKERLKITGEMIRLRRSTGQKGVPLEEDRSREKELEKQLADSTRKSRELEAGLEKARAEILQAREAQSAEIQRLTAQLNGIRDAAAKEYSELTERERREHSLSREAQDRDLQKARVRIKDLETDADRARSEIMQIREAQALEAQRLTAQLDSVRSTAAKEHAEQMERDRRESAMSREALERDLQKAQKELDLLKGSQSADQERQAAQLEESQKAHARIKELERRIAEARDSAGKEIADNIAQERRENATAREALERDLKKAQQEISLLKGAQSADLERQAGQLEESQKAHAKIKDLERRLVETGKETTSRLEKQVAESASSQQALERELQKARQESSRLKEQHAEELRLVMARLEESQTEIQQLERQLEETRDAVSADVVEQLRRQYDERMQEVIRQKTELSEQLNNASALLEAERSRFAAAAAAQPKAEPAPKAAGGSTIDTELLDAEFARVEGKIAEIARLIDDPSTELSLVIRKNVERAELDAYLKGILFSLGRSQGM